MSFDYFLSIVGLLSVSHSTIFGIKYKCHLNKNIVCLSVCLSVYLSIVGASAIR
ncbi:hypothetical protein DFA_03683 [Cavenderia fasciculata]|uniref:Uncharacterized protein n=1 Tax=Cavenderia fasciculata TaxID=261658 RepID=F4Q1P6_CACFS|nr:uncharacterized protein DFA_03683 [Cavenderia fasciculata]EGG18196.1 hypothetical protein DFA_03683 [Cavenderia fasciculata]|eukprot:XP_004357019.1 hypothetical protein DFA_03683 [Cavenderia fasciculata]